MLQVFFLGISKELNSTSDSERVLENTTEHSTSTGANADSHPRLGLQVPLCDGQARLGCPSPGPDYWWIGGTPFVFWFPWGPLFSAQYEAVL